MSLWFLALKARKAGNWSRTFYTDLTVQHQQLRMKSITAEQRFMRSSGLVFECYYFEVTRAYVVLHVHLSDDRVTTID